MQGEFARISVEYERMRSDNEALTQQRQFFPWAYGSQPSGNALAYGGYTTQAQQYPGPPTWPLLQELEA